MFSVTDGAIIYWLKKHDIKRRTISETRNVKHWGASGSDNPCYGKYNELSPTWKGGVSPERNCVYSRLPWKKVKAEVIERDMSRCRRCGKTEKESRKMHIHHIIPFNNTATQTDLDNLVLLCSKCHGYVHSKRNTNREYL